MIPIRPPLAMLLALFLPGAGHLYAGWPRHALGFAAVLPLSLVVLCVATATEVLSVAAFVPLICLVPITIQVAAAIDAGRRARTPVLAPHRISNRGVVVGFALASFAVTLFTVVALEGTTLSARRMSSATMTPSLLVGDYVVLRRSAFVPEIVAGDILEFRFPRDRRFTYLQRVVATGGQVLSMDATSPPVVDGVASEWSERRSEPWLSADCSLQDGTAVKETAGAEEAARTYGVLVAEPGPSEDVVVPDGALFVANDNRTYRTDSRSFGSIGRDEVSGQVLGIGFSWDPCAGSVRLDRVGSLD